MEYILFSAVFLSLALNAYLIFALIPQMTRQVVVNEQINSIKATAEAHHQALTKIIEKQSILLEQQVKQAHQNLSTEWLLQHSQSIEKQTQQHKALIENLQHGLDKLENTIREPIV